MEVKASQRRLPSSKKALMNERKSIALPLVLNSRENECSDRIQSQEYDFLL